MPDIHAKPGIPGHRHALRIIKRVVELTDIETGDGHKWGEQEACRRLLAHDGLLAACHLFLDAHQAAANYAAGERSGAACGCGPCHEARAAIRQATGQ